MGRRFAAGTPVGKQCGLEIRGALTLRGACFPPARFRTGRAFRWMSEARVRPGLACRRECGASRNHCARAHHGALVRMRSNQNVWVCMTPQCLLHEGERIRSDVQVVRTPEQQEQFLQEWRFHQDKEQQHPTWLKWLLWALLPFAALSDRSVRLFRRRCIACCSRAADGAHRNRSADNLLPKNIAVVSVEVTCPEARRPTVRRHRREGF
jgi:hypothetical protein